MKLRLLSAVLCFAFVLARAADEALPPTLVERLDESGLDYSVDDDGEARLLLDTVDDRNQLVWIRTDLTPLGDANLFHVYSFSHMSKNPLSRERLAHLVTENPQLILGAWSLRRRQGDDDEEWSVVFSVELPDSIDAGQLKTVLLTVAGTADTLEKEWTDTDRF